MLSAPIESLTRRLKSQTKASISAAPDESLINVNKLTEQAGAFYEKVRYLVDYKDERHIRRSAIERIVKRKILFEGGESIGLSLIQELIAGRYLANNAIPERVAGDVDRIVHKYITLQKYFPESFAALPRSRKIVVSLMSCEIENFFFPNNEDDFVADAFAATVEEHIKVDLIANDISTQVSLACYRSLLNADNETLHYRLWLKYNPGWLSCENNDEISTIGRSADKIFAAIHDALQDPLSFKIIPKLSNYSIYFSVIREIVRAYGAEAERVFSDEHMLQAFIRDFLEKNYKKQFLKARDSSFRAVLYIFCTKILLALAIEVPYEMYIIHNLQYTPLAINIVVHPLLLLCMTLSVGKLGADNTKSIIAGVEQVLSGEGLKLVKIKREQVGFFSLLFYCLYALMFLVVFGAIVAGLAKLGFSLISTALFLSFLALVSYFALRIRHSANKWKVTKENDRVISLLFNLFALPIVRAGKWLSRRFSSINLFVFVLDFIIETPFKFVLSLSDAFMSFLKEKQEDVY